MANLVGQPSLNRSHDCSYKRCNFKTGDYLHLQKTGRHVLSGADCHLLLHFTTGRI